LNQETDMEPTLAVFFDGQKFMWDGVKYDAETAAMDKSKLYQEKGFETRMVKEGAFLVYNRRVTVAEGAPPA
jgi:hypothetical protein